MLYKLLVSLMLTMIAAAAWPVNKPNFSGEWHLNLSKSSHNELSSSPTSTLRTITHAEPSLVIVDGRDSGRLVSRQYVIGGQITTFDVNGVPVRGSAAWEGRILILTTKATDFEMVTTEKMSLSLDGRRLTTDLQIDAGGQTEQSTLVFDRK